MVTYSLGDGINAILKAEGIGEAGRVALRYRIAQDSGVAVAEAPACVRGFSYGEDIIQVSGGALRDGVRYGQGVGQIGVNGDVVAVGDREGILQVDADAEVDRFGNREDFGERLTSIEAIGVAQAEGIRQSQGEGVVFAYGLNQGVDIVDVVNRGQNQGIGQGESLREAQDKIGGLGEVVEDRDEVKVGQDNRNRLGDGVSQDRGFSEAGRGRGVDCFRNRESIIDVDANLELKGVNESEIVGQSQGIGAVFAESIQDGEQVNQSLPNVLAGAVDQGQGISQG